MKPTFPQAEEKVVLESFLYVLLPGKSMASEPIRNQPTNQQQNKTPLLLHPANLFWKDFLLLAVFVACTVVLIMPVQPCGICFINRKAGIERQPVQQWTQPRAWVQKIKWMFPEWLYHHRLANGNTVCLGKQPICEANLLGKFLDGLWCVEMAKMKVVALWLLLSWGGFFFNSRIKKRKRNTPPPQSLLYLFISVWYFRTEYMKGNSMTRRRQKTERMSNGLFKKLIVSVMWVFIYTLHLPFQCGVHG